MANCSEQCSPRSGFFNFVSLTLLMLLISQEVTAATAGGVHRSIRIRDYDCSGGGSSSSSTTRSSRSDAVVIHRRMDALIQTSQTKDVNSFKHRVKVAVVADAGRNLPDHHQTRHESRVQRRTNTELSASSMASNNSKNEPSDTHKLPRQNHENTKRVGLDLTTASESSSTKAAMDQMSSDHKMLPLRRSLCTYTITTETGRKFGAGTDSTISLSLYNQNEDRVYFPSLDNGNNNFEKGHIDTFEELGPCVEDICKMILSTDNSGLFSDWFVESVNFSVTTPVSGHQEKRWILHQWLPSDDASAALFIMKDDCSNSAAVPPPSAP